MTRIPGSTAATSPLPDGGREAQARTALNRLAFSEALLSARIAASRYLAGAAALLYDPAQGFLAKVGEEGATLFEKWAIEEERLHSLALGSLAPEAARLFEKLTGEERELNRRAAATVGAARKSELHLKLIGEEAERFGERAWSAAPDAAGRLGALYAREEDLKRLAAECAAVVGADPAPLARRCLAQAALGGAKAGAARDPVGTVAFVEAASAKMGAEAFAGLSGELRDALVKRLSSDLLDEALEAGSGYSGARELIVEAGLGAVVTRRALELLEERVGGSEAAAYLTFAPELREEFGKHFGGRFPADREAVNRALLAFSLSERGLLNKEAVHAALKG